MTYVVSAQFITLHPNKIIPVRICWCP